MMAMLKDYPFKIPNIKNGFIITDVTGYIDIFYEDKKPKLKVYSVDSIPYDFNFNQELPEIIGEYFDMNTLNIIGYEQGDCTCKSPNLDWRNFIRVQKFNETRHPKTRVLCVKVLAWTKNNYNTPVLLTCKYK